jgi:hypothetical protein
MSPTKPKESLRTDLRKEAKSPGTDQRLRSLFCAGKPSVAFRPLPKSPVPAPFLFRLSRFPHGSGFYSEVPHDSEYVFCNVRPTFSLTLPPTRFGLLACSSRGLEFDRANCSTDYANGLRTQHKSTEHTHAHMHTNGVEINHLNPHSMLYYTKTQQRHIIAFPLYKATTHHRISVILLYKDAATTHHRISVYSM